VALGTAWFGFNLVAWLREVRLLRRVLRSIIPTGRIERREDLVRIKNYLSAHISYDARRVNDPRPLLRATAAHTLASGSGFCGENARVAMWLLGLGGVRSHRVYLEATRWQHTLVEHPWNGAWRFFDAHADPATLLPDDAVGRIDSRDLAALPNAHQGNAYVRAYRIRPFHTVWALRAFEQLRLPGPMALALESPALIQASSGALLAAAGILYARLG
jgi:hypothetical protein